MRPDKNHSSYYQERRENWIPVDNEQFLYHFFMCVISDSPKDVVIIPIFSDKGTGAQKR